MIVPFALALVHPAKEETGAAGKDGVVAIEVRHGEEPGPGEEFSSDHIITSQRVFHVRVRRIALSVGHEYTRRPNLARRICDSDKKT